MLPIPRLPCRIRYPETCCVAWRKPLPTLSLRFPVGKRDPSSVLLPRSSLRRAAGGSRDGDMRCGLTAALSSPLGNCPWNVCLAA